MRADEYDVTEHSKRSTAGWGRGRSERRRATATSTSATAPAPATTSPGDQPDRVGALRDLALRGSIIPAVTTIYALATLNRSDRASMLAVSAVLVGISLAVALAARLIVRSPLGFFINTVAVLAHLGGYGMLSHLDGGATAPLGALVFVALPFLAISMPPRVFVALALITVTTYWTVVLVDPDQPFGYAVVITSAYLLVSWLCARYTRALVSLRKRLTDLSLVDPLTGCLNRRGFDAHLAEEKERADRSGMPMTVVLVDLDGFKAVNDTLGHRVGDELLAWTGRTLQAAGRANDGIGRIGGDEFAMVLSGADAEGAAVVVDRLRVALDKVSPASMAHSTYPTEASDDESLMHLADSRLYEDKARRGDVRASIEAMVEAARETFTGKVLEVSRYERTAQIIGDLGWMVVFNVAIAALYLFFFADHGPSVLAVVIISIPGATGLALILKAAMVARSRVGSRVLTFGGPILFSFVAASAVLDGGVNSPLAFGMLNTLPLIALVAHWRISAPMCLIGSASYVGIGIVVGAPSGWYMALNVGGILAIAVACSLQGKAAASQRRLLNRLSKVDALTGAFNRRGLEEKFDGVLDRAQRRGDTFSLLVLDLDGFKQLNDTHGHLAGDDLLRWVAATLAELVRGSDLTGRLGGDEFIVLLAGCPAERATQIAERISVTLGARIPASIGAATFGVDGTDFDTLYRHADSLLYAEKARRKSQTPAPTVWNLEYAPIDPIGTSLPPATRRKDAAR